MLFYKKFFAAVLVFFCVSCKDDKATKQATQMSDLIQSNGKITETMREILAQTGVRIKDMPAKDSWPVMTVELNSADAETVMQLMQGKNPQYPHYAWYAQGKERWDIRSDFKKQQILLDLILTNKMVNGVRGLNMGAPLKTKSNDLTDVLLLGSTIGDFKIRAAFAKELLDANAIHADAKVYILTGKRSLNDQEKKTLTTLGTVDALTVLKADNETEGLQWIYKDIFKSTPEPVMVDDAHPKGVRASTASTLELFFDRIVPTKDTWANKKLLIVSSHIFALYQYLITKRVAFERGFTGQIDVCAPSFEMSERNNYSADRKVAMILDNLARIFYEICQYKKLTGHYPG